MNLFYENIKTFLKEFSTLKLVFQETITKVIYT